MDYSTLKDDALKALEYLGKINVEKAIEALKKPSLSDTLVVAEDAAELAKVVGIFVPPVAVAASDAEAIIGGIQFLMSVPVLSGRIPQVTLDTEAYIADRFQNPRY